MAHSHQFAAPRFAGACSRACHRCARWSYPCCFQRRFWGHRGRRWWANWLMLRRHRGRWAAREDQQHREAGGQRSYHRGGFLILSWLV